MDTVLDRTAEVKPTIDIQHLTFNEVLPIVNGQGASNGQQVGSTDAFELPVLKSPVVESLK